MEIITNYCWLFLGISVIALFYAIYNQIERMKNITKPHYDTDIGEYFFKGIYWLIGAMLISGVSFLLFVIGLLVKLFAK
jgi:predicted transporter